MMTFTSREPNFFAKYDLISLEPAQDRIDGYSAKVKQTFFGGEPNSEAPSIYFVELLGDAEAINDLVKRSLDTTFAYFCTASNVFENPPATTVGMPKYGIGSVIEGEERIEVATNGDEVTESASDIIVRLDDEINYLRILTSDTAPPATTVPPDVTPARGQVYSFSSEDNTHFLIYDPTPDSEVQDGVDDELDNDPQSYEIIAGFKVVVTNAVVGAAAPNPVIVTTLAKYAVREL